MPNWLVHTIYINDINAFNCDKINHFYRPNKRCAKWWNRELTKVSWKFLLLILDWDASWEHLRKGMELYEEQITSCIRHFISSTDFIITKLDLY